MANAFSINPPAPDTKPTVPISPMGAPGPTNALQGQAPAQQPMPPPPSHQQTVVALRHADALEKELTGLLKNPDCGKTDLRSEIIDATTKLVSEGFTTPAEAVAELGTVPDRPFDQKKWLENHLMQTVQAADMILAHHGAAFQGQNVDTTSPDPAKHTDMMAGLRAQYQGNQ
jgi:hypothetical protein